MPPSTLRHLLRTTPTIAQLSNRAVLYVSGSQSSEFLNGLLATVVPNLEKGPFYSAVLHAQGRVMHDVFVYPKKNAKGHDGYLIEYDSRPSEAPPLVSYFKQHVLRSKVKVQDVTEEYDVWAIWGHECMQRWGGPSKWNLAKSGVVEPVWNEDEWPWSSGPSCESMRDRRAPGMGRRVLARKGDRPSGTDNHDVVDTVEYTKHRILHGVPEGNDDMVPLHAFPMESNLDVMGALDFRKGCYVGQELTVRTYHTGVLRKRILPVQLRSLTGSLPNTTILPQCDIKTSYRIDSDTQRPRIRGTGKLFSNVHGIGLALMRLEHVDLAEKGIVKFQAEVEDGAEPSVIDVSHWWPSWWPTRDAES